MNENMPQGVIDYILQDVSDIVTGTTRNVANFITNLGHIFGRVFGKGFYGGNDSLPISIVSYESKGFI